MTDRCTKCGANLAMVGRAHRCIPNNAAPTTTQVQRRTGRPRIGEEAATLKATRPWEAAGMSKRTWYRRQKEKQP